MTILTQERKMMKGKETISQTPETRTVVAYILVNRIMGLIKQ